MGQFWTIFNIDKGMRTGSLGKFGQAFTEGGAAASLVKLLSSSSVQFPKDPLEGQPYKEARKRKSSQTGICDLPCELHDAIFAELRDPVDVVAFFLTASHFWRVGLYHYKALYMDHIRHAEDWSGDRLICMGDYADDWPEGLISNKRFEELEASYSYYFDDEPRNFYELLSEFSQGLRERQSQWPTYSFTPRCKLNEWNPLSREYRESRKKRGISLQDDGPVNDLPKYLPLYKYDFKAWLDLSETRSLKSAEHRERSEHKGPCILRNLSKKVYVRRDALALKSDDARTSVYYIIAWSNDRGMAMQYATDHDLHRGVWAGDRFDIVNIEAIEHDDDWTDVSAAAKKQLEEMWEDSYGNG
ncbi:hypothetical protein CPB85DRAFT_1289780 [Mucidula mucida]|nr:hypothetical protein CPB85DRAFT_1289780 [Mucidula mucida]